MLSRKNIKIYNDIAGKHGNVTVQNFGKHEKLKYKHNKLKLDIDFLNNCKQLGVYPKFFMFKLPNASNKMLYQYVKYSFAMPWISPIKNFNMSQKNSANPTLFLSKLLSTIDFCILNRSITSHNKKSLQKLQNTQDKNLSSLKKNCSLPTFTSNETLLTSHNMSYLRKSPIYLKQVYISLSK